MLSSASRVIRSYRTTPKVLLANRSTSSQASASQSKANGAPGTETRPDLTTAKTAEGNKLKKTVAEKDEELRLKMAGLAGDGGESGVEYEDGQPVAMKRGVKNNMFRYI
ncbi:hypothetical protein F5Y15DRAFT_415714 [Xylariaceae sp. FL0016]|nr:hypothetical protein F5Y15DRAFT_415714 [Xylariaceae sp. FL0016]